MLTVVFNFKILNYFFNTFVNLANIYNKIVQKDIIKATSAISIPRKNVLCKTKLVFPLNCET